MDKQLFKEMENKVRRYYQKDKLISSLKKQIVMLDKQMSEIDLKLKNVDITLEAGIKPISYEERVQTSGDGSSYAERQAMQITEFLLKRLYDTKMKKEELEAQIDKIEFEYCSIKDSIESIKGIYKDLLELAYKKHMNEQKIAGILNWNQSQINRKKWKLMEKIADWDMWNKVS